MNDKEKEDCEKSLHNKMNEGLIYGFILGVFLMMLYGWILHYFGVIIIK